MGETTNPSGKTYRRESDVKWQNFCPPPGLASQLGRGRTDRQTDGRTDERTGGQMDMDDVFSQWRLAYLEQ